MFIYLSVLGENMQIMILAKNDIHICNFWHRLACFWPPSVRLCKEWGCLYWKV